MASPTREQLLNLIKTNVQKFIEVKKSNPNLSIDLSGADLRKAKLNQAELGKVNLSGADLRDVDLSQAQIANANLEDADLSGATIEAANLHRAKMKGASLKGSKLGDLSKDSMRMCLHPASFENVEYDKEHLEAMLRVLNLNKSWLIKYSLEPK